jgi:acyl carrier protein
MTTTIKDDVREAVTAVLADLGVETDSLPGSALLGTDLELDSTDAVEIGLALKRQFGVTVKVQVKGDETVDNLVGLVVEEIGRTGS